MLIFSWALAESIYDLNQLINGKKVPLFKSKNQWKTDITGAVEKNKETNDESGILSLSYHDYLRIFLLLMNKDEKLARIQDLVQLNVGTASKGFLLKDCSAMLKADTEVSIRNLFISFQLSDLRNGKKLSRSYIKENYSIGY
jgi:hypothetical protein